MPETKCDCGKVHRSRIEYAIGDQVRIRVHWRFRHSTGAVTAKRPGFNEGTVYDVVLYANDQYGTGDRTVTGLLASELWAE